MRGGAAGPVRWRRALLQCALPAALLLPLLLPVPAAAAPRVPASGAEVLEVLPWRNDPQQREVRELRASLAQAPRDLGRATGVARRYIELGRREADPRYFGYAQAALAPWWNNAAPPAGVRLLRASLLQTEHRFPEALADLDAVTAAEPGNAQAWLTRATVETVSADYPAATRSCARLSSLADELVTTACIANVGAMTGRLHASEALLAATYKRGAGGDAAVDAWVLGGLAEMAARRGDAAGARARFRQALALAPGDSYLLAAYADFLLEQRRHDAVLALLAPHLRVDGLLLRHALALSGAGDRARLAPELAELGARFEAGERRGDGVHLREQARFELQLRGDAARAARLAQRNWTAQKELADARVLLEAAMEARQPAAARPVLDWMNTSGVEDPALARLAQQLGQQAKGTKG
jgi:tetratricopeptide (TPR) repeat protein